ncbi:MULTISPECIES: DUF397 domain-containing protein [Streptomyces]|uniref:DUF397 domain-containing protein n=1 Tax=Streptomyces TaxID=1883 RepID=UPI00163D1414|nr:MULTISPECIES: DUF397 domain-containing protein [Streptomyces]MBC2877124.1 DUF397 domain-containing protein [Streptomyces sp. TYQ1024]UBI39397.1 DUF397 domain-containing protein [Streptomyces mobaraensis]UKW31977.1 DUF397 domain-containing protein [Streptomyces sp. TYQ1024]
MNRKADLCTLDLTGATWRKSSHSNGGNGCVEITELPGPEIAVRDSKDHGRGHFRLPSESWSAFCSFLAGE